MIKKNSRVGGHRRVRDFISYTLISFVAIAPVIVAALRGVPESQIMYWVWMVLVTAAVFGQFIFVNKHFWKRKPFWTLCAASLAIHLLVCILLLHFDRPVSGIQWLLLAAIEILILVIFRNLMFGPKSIGSK
jgi:hypothetical protein